LEGAIHRTESPQPIQLKAVIDFLATADAVLGLALVAVLDLRFVRALAGLASGAPPIV